MSYGEPTIQQEVVKYLRKQPEIAALCGERVYARYRKPGEPVPAITMHTVSATRLKTTLGPCEMAIANLQLDIWAATEAEAKQLYWAIVGKKNDVRLDGYGPALMGEIWVASASVDEARDIDEAPAHGEVQGLYRTSLDVSIMYDEV